MSREEEYRRRLHEVNEALKRRLEYQLEMESLEKQFQQRHIVAWIHDAVREALKTKPVGVYCVHEEVWRVKRIMGISKNGCSIGCVLMVLHMSISVCVFQFLMEIFAINLSGLIWFV